MQYVITKNMTKNETNENIAKTCCVTKSFCSHVSSQHRNETNVITKHNKKHDQKRSQKRKYYVITKNPRRPSEPQTRVPKISDLAIRDPKTSALEEARVREARVQKGRVREASFQEPSISQALWSCVQPKVHASEIS